jgi:hypothetical protein
MSDEGKNPQSISVYQIQNNLLPRKLFSAQHATTQTNKHHGGQKLKIPSRSHCVFFRLELHLTAEVDAAPAGRSNSGGPRRSSESRDFRVSGCACPIWPRPIHSGSTSQSRWGGSGAPGPAGGVATGSPGRPGEPGQREPPESARAPTGGGEGAGRPRTRSLVPRPGPPAAAHSPAKQRPDSGGGDGGGRAGVGGGC